MTGVTEFWQNTGPAYPDGGTSKNSTPPNCRQLSLFAEDTLASLLVLPGSEKARKMTATSGRSFFPLLPQSGPLGVCLRTLLGTSRWSSTVCFLTWEISATPARRSLFRLVPRTPSTAETGSGLLPTPTVADAKGVSTENCHRQQGRKRTGLRYRLHHEAGYPNGTHYPHPDFVEALMEFPEGWTVLED